MLQFGILRPYIGDFLVGAAYTLLLSFVGVVGSFVLAVPGVAARLSRFRSLNWLATAYVHLFRNTPLLVVLYVIYFGLGSIGLRLGSVEAACLGLTLNSAAYTIEIYRGGIAGISSGQLEAANALGLKAVQRWRYVVLPQALRIAFYPLGNQVIQVVLGSSLAVAIAGPELTSATYDVGALTYRVLRSILCRSPHVLLAGPTHRQCLESIWLGCLSDISKVEALVFESPLALTYLRYILQGLRVTLELSAVALALRSILGFAGGAVRTSSRRRLRAAMAGYVTVFRSVPVVIQLFLVFYGAPVVLGIDLPAFGAATVTLAVYFGAYMTEVVRAGIEALPRGQTDAAHALGLGYIQTMRLVILPQALRVIMPGWVGLVLSGVKDSSLASIIGVTELTSASLTVRSNTYSNWDVFAVLAGTYFVVCSVISGPCRSRLEEQLRIVQCTSVSCDLSGRRAGDSEHSEQGEMQGVSNAP